MEGVGLGIPRRPSSKFLDAIHDPYSSRVEDTEGFLPLHRAIQDELESDVIIPLIRDFPKACSQQFPNSKDYPLHVALFKKLPSEVIIEILKYHPEGCKVKDDFSEYPLQIATSGAFSLEVYKTIYSNYPEAIRAYDDAGWLPLHRAVFHNAPAKVISFLIDCDTTACEATDPSLNLPIHIALRANATINVVQVLLDAFPDSLKYPDNNGWLPLHTAAAFYPSPQVITLLIKSYKDACQATNIVGRLPIHCLVTDGVMSNGRLDCLRILLKAYPAGAHYQMLSNGGSPIDAARRGWRGIPALRLLLNAEPRLFAKQSSNISQYKHLNWKARKAAIRVYVKIMTDKKTGNSLIPKTVLIESLVRRNYNPPVTNGHSYVSSQYSYQKYKNPNAIVPLFIKICEKFESKYHLAINNDTLRYIITYL